MRKTHGNREKKRRIHDDRVKVNDRKNPSKSKEESRQFEKRKKVLFDFINDDLYVPMKIKEIAVVLQIPGEQRQELREVLDALVEEGKITISKRGKYTCGHTERLKGIFQANARGFGFVTPEDGTDDIFIPEECLGNAFQGDEVEYILSLIHI